MKTKFPVLTAIIIIFIIAGLMIYFDYSKLTTLVNGMPQEGYCDDFPNPFCIERPLDLNFFEYLQYKIFSWGETSYIGGGVIDLDPDLSPTYALDFMGGLFYPTIISIASLFAGISALFLVPYFILKRKNMPSRPYMALILSGILCHYGISNLIPFGNQLSTILHLLDKESSFFIQQVLPQFLIPVIALAIAGILLYKSSVIRGLLKR